MCGMKETIQLGPSGQLDDIERQFLSSIKNFDLTQELEIGINSIEFICIESLIFLVSLVSRRMKDNLRTKIIFPSSNLKSFIITSRLFETISSITGLHTTEFVTNLPSNYSWSIAFADYFDKTSYEFTSTGERIKLSDEDKVQHLIDIGFYPLLPLPFSNSLEKKTTLKEEPKKWTDDKNIINLIQKHISGKINIGNNISKHIIYESITNAIRHPNSQDLVISCVKERDNCFKLIIWDSGDSIIDTLLYELESGNPIKTIEESLDDPQSCYCRKKFKRPGPPKIEYFDYYFSHEVPTTKPLRPEDEYKKEKWFILLSSLFPGITRDPDTRDYQDSGVLQDESKPILGGRGLTYLVNEVVRHLDGILKIRTGNQLLEITRAEKDNTTFPDLFIKKYGEEYFVLDWREKYHSQNMTPINKRILDSLFEITLTDFDGPYEDFYGNLFIIQIPINKKDNKDTSGTIK